MFIFKLSNFEEQGVNYPKYSIILENKHYYSNYKNIFYYLIVYTTQHINITDITNDISKYLITLNLSFDMFNEDDKFDLSKLGTDYIVNKLCIHFKDECIGSYPDNYIFVNEPVWPYDIKDRTDKTPLKHIYL